MRNQKNSLKEKTDNLQKLKWRKAADFQRREAQAAGITEGCMGSKLWTTW